LSPVLLFFAIPRQRRPTAQHAIYIEK